MKVPDGADTVVDPVKPRLTAIDGGEPTPGEDDMETGTWTGNPRLFCWRGVDDPSVLADAFQQDSQGGDDWRDEFGRLLGIFRHFHSATNALETLFEHDPTSVHLTYQADDSPPPVWFPHHMREHGSWHVEIDGDDWDGMGDGASLPIAIAHALMCWDGEKPTIPRRRLVPRATVGDRFVVEGEAQEGDTFPYHPDGQCLDSVLRHCAGSYVRVTVEVLPEPEYTLNDEERAEVEALATLPRRPGRPRKAPEGASDAK
jgi:hypothetical protein